jgi:hypothetical protein
LDRGWLREAAGCRSCSPCAGDVWVPCAGGNLDDVWRATSAASQPRPRTLAALRGVLRCVFTRMHLPHQNSRPRPPRYRRDGTATKEVESDVRRWSPMHDLFTCVSPIGWFAWPLGQVATSPRCQGPACEGTCAGCSYLIVTALRPCPIPLPGLSRHPTARAKLTRPLGRRARGGAGSQLTAQ